MKVKTIIDPEKQTRKSSLKLCNKCHGVTEGTIYNFSHFACMCNITKEDIENFIQEALKKLENKEKKCNKNEKLLD